MKNKTFILIYILLFTFANVANAQDKQVIPKSIKDPVADPHIAYFKKEKSYFIYPTSAWRGSTFKTYESKDLVNWEDKGVIIDFKDVSWAEGLAWAPCIAEKKKKYYFYFSADKKIGVAVSKKPTGPFTDPIGKPLLDANNVPQTCRTQIIDPMVYTDTDGTSYIFFGSGNFNVAKLNDDMVSVDESSIKRISSRKDNIFGEGVFMIKRNDIYYLMWSQYSTRDPRYCVNYATAESPMGPYTVAKNNPILTQEGVVIGTGHNSVVKVPKKDEWYIAYHRFGMPGGSRDRETCISPMRFDKEGNILSVDVYEGVTSK